MALLVKKYFAFSSQLGIISGLYTSGCMIYKLSQERKASCQNVDNCLIQTTKNAVVLTSGGLIGGALGYLTGFFWPVTIYATCRSYSKEDLEELIFPPK